MHDHHEDTPVVLSATNIHKTFYDPNPIHVLRGVNIEVRQGETVAIMGRSGEGKSTLLHILGTLETQTQGTISIVGKGVSSYNKATMRNRHVGFVFQSFHLLNDFTVLNNVLLPAWIRRVSISSRSPAFQRAEHLLEQVGLAHRADYLAKLLSGGERQRVAIARAMCNDPDIILADEPTGNLDHQTASGIHEVLLNFAREKNKTLIVVTHNQELASLCDKKYHIHDGILVTV